jgi:NNP family nitrate/nitrite transporter-like MFS transporter
MVIEAVSPQDVPRVDRWDPEDSEQWVTQGNTLANRTLWITTSALTLSFATWFVWSAIVVRLPAAGFALSVSDRFWLVAVPGLIGATLRIPYSFVVQLFGTRRVVVLATAALLIPCLGIGFAVQNPTTSYTTLLALAAAAGFGGGNFSAFMSSTSLFFPKIQQGTALGIQAGLGNLGVSLVQFLAPWLITVSAIGIGEGQILRKGTSTTRVWLHSAAFFWVIPIVITVVAAHVWLRDVPVKATIKAQSVIFRRKHTWVMTSLYMMTFGTFSGFAAATGILIGEVFSIKRFTDAPDPLAYAFIGPLIGSLMRPVGGYISDKWGGAKVTLSCALLLAVTMVGLAKASHPSSTGEFPLFLSLLLIVFFTSGIGNGSTFRMIPALFVPKEAAPVLGWTAAIAAYGAFFLPLMFGTALSRSDNADGAFYTLGLFYLTNAVLCFWFYARNGAERPC